MKTGLVLEGGGLRGVFSAGVMDVLMEEGIEFDGAIGVSAGAAFGCNYKSRQPRRAILYNMKFAKDPRYSSMRSLIATGDLFNAQFCYHESFTSFVRMSRPESRYIICAMMMTTGRCSSGSGLPDPCPWYPVWSRSAEESSLTAAYRILFLSALWSSRDMSAMSSFSRALPLT